MAKENIINTIKSFSGQFWILNFLQMIEKLAYWIVLLQMPVYIAQKDAAGGLMWGQATKGVIFFWWAAVQNLSPLIFGSWADRYGRKRLLFISFIIIISGYILLGNFRDFYPFVAATILLGLGSGMFKPALQGAIAAKLNEKNSSTGWGIYFMLLNLAVFFGPAVSKYLKEISWEMVFWGSAMIFALNFLVLMFFRESKNTPRHSDDNRESKIFSHSFIRETKGEKQDHTNTLKSKAVLANLFKPRVIWFILIMSGFMTIYMQFYETLPNFLIDWTDTTFLVDSLNLPDFLLMETKRGLMISYEWLYTLNSIMIIAFVVIISRVFGRIDRMKAIALGIVLSTFGLVLSGVSMIGIMTICGIIIYTFGEMITNPKFTEHLGSIATKDSKSMYLSYLNISLAFGLGFGSLLGGYFYGKFGEKATLAMDYLNRKYDINSEISISKAMEVLCEKTGMSSAQATEMLWREYDPYLVWLPFLIIGIASVAGIWFYLKRFSRIKE